MGRRHNLAWAVGGDEAGQSLRRYCPMLREPAVGRVDREAGELGSVAASSVQALPVRADRQCERPAGYGDLTLRGEHSGVGVDGQHRYFVILLRGTVHVVRLCVPLPLGSVRPFSNPHSTTNAIRSIL